MTGSGDTVAESWSVHECKIQATKLSNVPNVRIGRSVPFSFNPGDNLINRWVFIFFADLTIFGLFLHGFALLFYPSAHRASSENRALSHKDAEIEPYSSIFRPRVLDGLAREVCCRQS